MVSWETISSACVQQTKPRHCHGSDNDEFSVVRAFCSTCFMPKNAASQCSIFGLFFSTITTYFLRFQSPKLMIRITNPGILKLDYEKYYQVKLLGFLSEYLFLLWLLFCYSQQMLLGHTTLCPHTEEGTANERFFCYHSGTISEQLNTQEFKRTSLRWPG